MRIKTDTDTIADFFRDASNLTGTCEAVYFPSSAVEAAEAVRACMALAVPLTIAGNGTGLTGARVPNGGRVLASAGMNKILNFDAARAELTVQCGAVLKDIQEFLAALGFFYPPDPTETSCFIGGTIATNASGAKSFGYGPTRAFVRALEVVLPTGDLLWLRRGDCTARGGALSLPVEGREPLQLLIPPHTMPAVKNASGYYLTPDMDAVDLFIGSEGTLGFITQAVLRAEPLPAEILSCVAYFPGAPAARAFIAEARASARSVPAGPLRPIALEYFDGHSLRLLAPEYPGIPGNAGGAVWFEEILDGNDPAAVTEAWLALAGRHGADAGSIWYAAGPADRAAMMEFRHAVSWKINDIIARRGLRKLGSDCAVPAPVFEQFITETEASVSARGIPWCSYGHFGDCHLHLNFLPANEKEHAAASEEMRLLITRALAFGGTVSAEHGIGKIKREYLRLMYGPGGIAAMRSVKAALDPLNLFGRGTLFTETE